MPVQLWTNLRPVAMSFADRPRSGGGNAVRSFLFGFLCGALVAALGVAGVFAGVRAIGLGSEREHAEEVRADLERARAAGRRAGEVAERSWRRAQRDAATIERLGAEARAARELAARLGGRLDSLTDGARGIGENVEQLRGLLDELPPVDAAQTLD